MKLEHRQFIYCALVILLVLPGLSLLLFPFNFGGKEEMSVLQVILIKILGLVMIFIGERIFKRHFKINSHE